VNELIVIKLDENGNHVWEYPAVELARGDHFVRLEAYFNRDELNLGFATFARGDRFIEYFYNNRWYNIFAVHNGRSDELKGWYCNVCRPATLGESEIHCEDLALDVWVPPGGQPLVLDEDEFATLEITAEDRQLSLAALGELLRMARSGELPR
jgi:predicted RNA-binding protein associated with RNAse of E/G family